MQICILSSHSLKRVFPRNNNYKKFKIDLFMYKKRYSFQSDEPPYNFFIKKYFFYNNVNDNMMNPSLENIHSFKKKFCHYTPSFKSGI